jgi:hypothetical protein
MKYAIYLLYDNGRGAYLDVKGRHTWKTKRAAQRHLDVCQTLLAKGRFFNGVVEVNLERAFFA